MKTTTMKKLSYVLAAGLLVFGLPSCCEKDTPVIPKEITSLEVKPSAVVMQIGETKSLEVTWEPQDIEVTPVFSSDKAEVASVDDKGAITAVAEGEAVITVKAGKLEKTVSVSVSKSLDPNEITSLSVTPQEVSLKVGETEQLTATWEPQTATPEVTYESDKAEVASVDDKGLITAVAEGEANITVKAGNQMATVTITVAEEEVPMLNELPLLKFRASEQDTEVIDYERKIGRESVAQIPGTIFGGFLNMDLTIVASIYGVYTYDETTDMVLAYSKESIDDCPLTTAMLAEYGFTDLEEGVNERFIKYKKGVNGDVEVFLYDTSNGEIGSNMEICFQKPR